MSGLAIGTLAIGGAIGYGQSQNWWQKKKKIEGLQQAPKSLTESKLFGPIFQGKGGVYDALARRGTGYTPGLFQQANTANRNIGRTELDYQLAANSASASGRGLGRSSVVQSQEGQHRTQLAQNLAAQDAAMRERSQLQEIAQQQNARSLGVGAVQADTSAGYNAAALNNSTRLNAEAQERAELQQRVEAYNRGAQTLTGTASGLAGAGAFGGLGGGASSFSRAIPTSPGAYQTLDAGDLASINTGTTRSGRRFR